MLARRVIVLLSALCAHCLIERPPTDVEPRVPPVQFVTSAGVSTRGALTLIAGPRSDELSLVGSCIAAQQPSLELMLPIARAARPTVASDGSFTLRASLGDPFDYNERARWRIAFSTSPVAESTGYYIEQVVLEVDGDANVRGEFTLLSQSSLDERRRLVIDPHRETVRVEGRLSTSCLGWLEPEAERTGAGTVLIDTERRGALCREWIVPLER